MRDRARERLIQVAIGEHAFTAEALRDQLQAAGIPAMVRNRNAGGGVFGAGPSFGHEVLVLEGDAARAAAMLGVAPPPLPAPRLARPVRPRARRRRWW